MTSQAMAVLTFILASTLTGLTWAQTATTDPSLAAPSSTCIYDCSVQSDASQACWKCLGWNPSTRTMTVDFSGCGFTSMCCPPDSNGNRCRMNGNGSGSGRRLLQDTLYSGGNTTTVSGTGSGWSGGWSTGRRSLRQTSTSDFTVAALAPGTKWRNCSSKSNAGCCQVGAGGCAKNGVCDFTINQWDPTVCPLVS